MADDSRTNDVPVEIEAALERLASGDRERHGEDYTLLLEATAGSVAWANAAWARVFPLLAVARPCAR